ncbi:MAG TPA: DNA recombination protein RmuC, partial [Terriglobales bacterium]
MSLLLLLGIVIGTIAGACAAHFAARVRSASSDAQLTALRAQTRELQARVVEQQRALDNRGAELTATKQALAGAEAQRDAAFREATQKGTQLEKFGDELRVERQRAEALNAHLAQLRTSLDEQKKSYEQQMTNLREAEARLKDTFSAVAAEVLKGNNQQFLDLAKSELERQQTVARNDLDSRKKEVEVLVKPIADNLDKLNREVQQIENKRENAYGDIKAQIEGLRVTGNEIKAEAARLVGALKMPQQRGRWGEIQLRRVVELAGMVRYCDFDEQVGVRDSDDNLLRPDMTVRLPGGRTIVVDSKVSLSAYLEAAASDDETLRSTKLRDHAAQVRTHLLQLAKKTYWNQFDCTPEFVVAFL